MPIVIISKYSLKLIDAKKHLYRFMLHYEPVKGESGIDKDFVKPLIGIYTKRLKWRK
jgi:hypothetical protein